MSMPSFLYAKKCKDWKSDEPDKIILKMGCTTDPESRKWSCITDHFNLPTYVWVITIFSLGQFTSLRQAEQTVFNYSYFKSRRRINDAGTEYFQLEEYSNSLQKVCEVLVQYDCLFSCTNEDIYLIKPRRKISEDFDDSIDDPDDVVPLNPITKPLESRVKKLRPYQRDALHVLQQNSKGIVVMATGTGKTVVFCKYIKLTGKGLFLIVVPTLKLVSQTIAVCKKNIGEQVYKYSTYMKNKNFIKSEDNPVVIVGTYMNSHNLHEIEGIDCIIFDECHSTVVGNREDNLTTSSDEDEDEEDEKEIEDTISQGNLSRYQKLLGYKCTKKFFFTATEKVKGLLSNQNISMDNEEIYGKVLYRYDLAKAISEGYLTDYKIEIVATENKEKACLNSVLKNTKSVVFCSTKKTVLKVYDYIETEKPDDLAVFKLNKDGEDIDSITKKFSEYEGRAVLISCKKINVGYDEPSVSNVIHYSVSTSSIMTIQRNGRGLRLYKDKIMATLVFLVDLSGDEESRKREIKALHKSVQYLKEFDTRLPDRIEKEKTKDKECYTTVDIKVEISDEKECRKIYNSCWEELQEKEYLTFDEAKELVKRKGIDSKEKYWELKDSRLPENPQEEYSGKFLDWVDYFGLERKEYLQYEVYKKEFNELYRRLNEVELSKVCKVLEERGEGYPKADMITEIYKLPNLGAILEKKKETKNIDLKSLFK